MIGACPSFDQLHLFSPWKAGKLMKALVVYESAWGNTREVAEAISSGLSDRMDTHVIAVDTAPPLRDVQVDLLVVGAPTHAFGLSREATREDAHQRGGDLIPSGVREWLESDPVSLLVATFDTHVRHPNLPGHASRKTAKKLEKLGCEVLIEPESFYVRGYEGPLLDGEVDRARSWGEELARSVMSREEEN